MGSARLADSDSLDRRSDRRSLRWDLAFDHMDGPRARPTSKLLKSPAKCCVVVMMRGAGIAECAWLRRGVIALACLAACGDNVSPPDAPVAGFVPAPHVPLPRVAPHSGTVLSAVQLATITYADDAQRAQLESFADALLSSPWYTAVGLEYGVRIGTQLATVHLGPAPATLSRADLTNELQALVATHQVPLPLFDAANQIVYVLYVPSTVSRAADLPASFHSTITVKVADPTDLTKVKDVAVPFAVVLEDASDLDLTTVAAARVLVNTASDPYPVPNDGFYADPPATDPWSLMPAEIADLCAGDPPVALDTVHPTLRVPRVYSNTAAASGGSPCTPLAADDQWYDVSADPTQLQPVPPGGLATFHLVGWSTHQMPAWRLSIERAERSQLSITDMAPELDNDTINNDLETSLTLHVPLTAQPGQVGGVTVVSGPSSHLWTVGVVVTNGL
jgi:hypothetical protein